MILMHQKCLQSLSPSLLELQLLFSVYDLVVQRRNERLILNAARSNAIVSSMFPSNIRDQLIGQKPGAETGIIGSGPKQGNLKTFLNDGKDVDHVGNSTFGSKPLADLFLETTVLFADVVGKFQFAALLSIKIHPTSYSASVH